jgi:DNA (cytosine-5)-methyltransferase 1
VNGLDLFSGIGGISLALRPWVRTVAYCEQDRYAQGVLLSRMSEGKLCMAPIWDDVTTLNGSMLPEIDIIFGGFPCQDISVAGRGEGLAGERSGLFFEIVRLAEEIKPTFIFLENVPAIRTRGLSTVGESLDSLGYDCRWTTLSAEEVGAPHLRNRWFLLAKNQDPATMQRTEIERGESDRDTERSKEMAHTNGHALRLKHRGSSGTGGKKENEPFGRSWWSTEPNVGRMAHGIPNRVDRLRCLGNSVVPLQAREAFKELAGLN